MDFLTSSLIALPQDTLHSPSEQHKLSILNQAASIYIRRCLDHINVDTIAKTQEHLIHLAKWMKRCHFSDEQVNSNEMTEQDVLQHVRCLGIEGELLSRIGSELPSILTSRANSLELVLKGDVLTTFYRGSCFVQGYTYMSRYIKHLCFKDPHMKVLEIGGGTGGVTIPLLKALSQNAQSSFHRYDFTDISAGSFNRMQESCHEWANRMSFRTLDY